jgi:uncharacterized protein (DUF1330 family)
MAIDPRGADLKRLLTEDDGGPFVMLNLLRFADGKREQYDEYVTRADEFVKRYGGELIYYGDASTVLVAEPGQEWEAVVLVRYPSRQAFSEMVADPEYHTISHLRTGALSEAVLQATTPREL